MFNLNRYIVLIILSLFLGCFSTATSTQPVTDALTIPDKSKKDALHSSAVVGIYKIDNNSFISASSDGQIIYWTLGANPTSYELYKLPSQPDHIAFSSKSKLLAAVYHDHIDILPLTSTAPTYSLNRMRSVVLDCAFLSDGKSLLLAGADGKIYRWRFVDESTTRSLKEHQKSFEVYFGLSTSVSAVVSHAEKRLFFTGDWGGGLNAWLTYDSDRQKGAYDENLFGDQFFAEQNRRANSSRSGPAVEKIATTDDGNLLIVGSQKGDVEIWKVRGFRMAATLPLHNGEITALAVDPLGNYIASSGRDGKIVISNIRRLNDKEMIELEDRRYDYEIKVIKEHPMRARALLFVGENQLIAGLESGDVVNISFR